MSTIIGLVSTFRLPLQRDTSEVQKEQETMTDWTSKWRETRQKSKKSKKEPQNGRQSNKNASRGPKR